jgi:hypothetical protein
MTGTHKAYRTKSPGKIEVVHEAELSKNFGLANINWSIFGLPGLSFAGKNMTNAHSYA